MKTLDEFIKELQEIRKEAGKDIPVVGETCEGKEGIVILSTLRIARNLKEPPTKVIIEIGDLDDYINADEEDFDAL